jgi:hypothetical protein
MNRDMEIRIKTQTKRFILPHKKNSLMTKKNELLQLIYEQYTKLYLSPTKMLLHDNNVTGGNNTQIFQYKPLVISMKCGDVDILASKRSLPDIFFKNKMQRGHLYVVTIEAQLLFNRCRATNINDASLNHFFSRPTQNDIAKKVIAKFVKIRDKINTGVASSNSNPGNDENENKEVDSFGDIDRAFEKFGVFVLKPLAENLPAIVASKNTKRRLRSHRKKKRQKLTANEKELRLNELTAIEKLRYAKGHPIVSFDFAKQYLALQNILQNLEKQTCRLEYSTKQVFLRKARDNTKTLENCKSNEDIFEWMINELHMTTYDAVKHFTSAFFPSNQLLINLDTSISTSKIQVSMLSRGSCNGIRIAILVDYKIISEAFVKNKILANFGEL